jgi:hypothetical protein
MYVSPTTGLVSARWKISSGIKRARVGFEFGVSRCQKVVGKNVPLGDDKIQVYLLSKLTRARKSKDESKVFNLSRCQG